MTGGLPALRQLTVSWEDPERGHWLYSVIDATGVDTHKASGTEKPELLTCPGGTIGVA